MSIIDIDPNQQLNKHFLDEMSLPYIVPLAATLCLLISLLFGWGEFVYRLLSGLMFCHLWFPDRKQNIFCNKCVLESSKLIQINDTSGCLKHVWPWCSLPVCFVSSTECCLSPRPLFTLMFLRSYSFLQLSCVCHIHINVFRMTAAVQWDTSFCV